MRQRGGRAACVSSSAAATKWIIVEHKLSGLSDAELQQRLLEAEEELAKAGITIDLEAKEVVALPSLQHARCRLLPCFAI